MKRKTHNQFVEEMKIIHPNLKILVQYINSQTKILIEDNLGIKYLSKPNDLLNHHPPTIQTALNKTHAFKVKLKLIQSNLTVTNEYINSQTKILVKDKLGIIYNILPNDLLQNVTPTIQSALNKNQAFEIMAKNIHGNSYDYSLIQYIKGIKKIIIKCKKCNSIFNQRPDKHLQGDGCPTCGLEKAQSANKQILKERILTITYDINKKHNNRINCDKLIYKGNKEKSIFGCNVNPEHDYWLATPNDILDGCGCPSCNSSKGELRIETFLKNKKIKHIKYKTFPGCKYKNLLRFDFYLPDYNACIEFDGIQHFKSIPVFGGDKVFEDNKIRDQIKNKFCKDQKINLFRIPYIKLEKIENIISNFLNNK